MRRKELVVEAELHDVAIGHDVFLALNASLALGASLSDGARLDEVVEADDLSLDEALFEVSVDDAGSLRRLGALRDRPGASLFRTRREIRRGRSPSRGQPEPPIRRAFRRCPAPLHPR